MIYSLYNIKLPVLNLEKKNILSSLACYLYLIYRLIIGLCVVEIIVAVL